ncbi:MAG TPA: winged helix-turn-helix domain-containing protein [Burkholderiales bacterium]|nr:winged helix-turn-helix domain-containing protein [Burkholderiales bacterium]
MNPQPGPTTIIQFGRIAVLPLRRELRVDGEPVELGDRAFDVLMALVEAGGRILGKDELMARVWPDRVVEENNLQVQIAALRKALAEERELIRTIAGRGYQFTGTVQPGSPANVGVATQAAATNLPEAVSELFGRDAELKEIIDLVAERRLVTLTGSGGIGKTRLAVEAARRLLSKFPDGVWIAELGALTDPNLVPVTVAAGLGLTFATGALSPERMAAALDSKRFLLVLDNCEHVIDAAASMAEAVLRASQLACVLATSREPLRAEGESLYRVPSLDVPAEQIVDREQLLKSGAVKLFLARTRAAEAQLSTDTRIAAMAAVCRRLDGIPLAIELAAARAAAIGIEGLAARLDDRFRLLTGGHRTALPRHQTLRATLDWSYELLPATERVILRRLSVFAGSFTLESAGAVVSGGEIAAADVVDYVANLVAKSLVTADVNSAIALYRLLDTMRAYALEKLRESGEFEDLTRRHAEHNRDLFERAAAEQETRPTAEWLDTYGRQIDNLRTALDWAFSPRGDAEIGAALTIAAVPLWVQLSLMDECSRRVESALGSLGTESGRGTRREMQLLAALGASLSYTKSPVPESGAAWTSALEFAESLNDIEYQLRALWGLWIYRLSCGECRTALAVAQRFCSLGANSADPGDVFIGDRMIGVSLHYLGDQANARHHIERMLSLYVARVHQSHIIRFQFDQRVAGRMILVRVLWVQGFPDQAVSTAQENVEDARAIGHALSLCYALEAACLATLFVGDLPAAERSVAMLLDQSARHSVMRWDAWGRCFQGVLVSKRGDVVSGARLLRSALEELRETRFVLRYTAFLGELAEALGRTGEIAQGLETIDEALALSDRNEERWCIAELLRIKGELLLREDAPNAGLMAEGYFRQGLDWASRQGALSWELRGALSLARLRKLQGRAGEARELLAAVVSRFTEGFGTADLKAAKFLLDSLQQP